ncbi:RING/FYVE/PHD-type zinc finger family protein [Tanacetum coccineum]
MQIRVPLSEDTGVWIPVLVPPMSESQREEWNRGLCLRMNTTNYLQDNKIEWDQFIGEYKESTMWDVVLDMLLAAQERMRSITPGDAYVYQISWLSDQLLEHTSKEFHPIICSRHHCRFRRGLFCNECSKGRTLMPAKFLKENPQRVCDVALALKCLFCKQPDVKASFE